jgi:hypothetical protein
MHGIEVTIRIIKGMVGKMKFKGSTFGIILLVVVMISSMVSSIVFAANINFSYSILRLEQLGILSSSIENPNSFVTRKQLVEALVVASNMMDNAANLAGSTIFQDIDPNSKLSGYVNEVIEKGLMYGMPDGYFHPEREVTYGEVCTILVKLLGYTDSDVTGVWPNNYINKARDLKLNDKITLKRNESITIGAAAEMLDTLLDTNVKKTSASGMDKTFSECVNLYTDIVVYDNVSTYSSLASNALLTDKGVLYLSDSNLKLQVGNEYRINLEDGNITNVYGKVKETVSVTIDSVIDKAIYYKEGLVQKSMNIPSGPDYYYHGGKVDYNSVAAVLKPNTTVILAYNDDKTGFEYAVIIDSVYSIPEVASGFDANANSLGDMSFDLNTPIIKNGQSISKYEIEELDVVYSVTDISGNNRAIVVYNDRAEGNIEALLPNGMAPTSIQIDNGSYYFSKDMNLSKLSSLKVGEKVSALLGHDGKVVDVVKIDYKTAGETEIKILGNVNTSDDLLDNQVLTDSGKYYLLDSIGKLEVGGKYKVAVDGDTIVKVKSKKNSLDILSVRHVIDITVYYGGGETPSEIILPRISTYYYHGEKIDYNTVLESLEPASSIILSKVDGIYEYGVIVDPVYSKPIISNYANKDAIAALDDSEYLFIYRNGSYLNGIGWIEMGDVAYNVSDLWGMNRYIYVSDTEVKGRVASIMPNKIAPKSIQISNVTYSFSKYFDSSLIYKKDINNDDYVTLTLDKDGKVIDISR